MKKELRIYLLLSASLSAVTGWVFFIQYLVRDTALIFLFMLPLSWACFVITALYIFGTPGVWLFEATVGKLIEKIERE